MHCREWIDTEKRSSRNFIKVQYIRTILHPSYYVYIKWSFSLPTLPSSYTFFGFKMLPFLCMCVVNLQLDLKTVERLKLSQSTLMVKFKVVLCLLAYTLPLINQPNGLD